MEDEGKERIRTDTVCVIIVAWLLTCTALVWLMIPGLGYVRRSLIYVLVRLSRMIKSKGNFLWAGRSETIRETNVRLVEAMLNVTRGQDRERQQEEELGGTNGGTIPLLSCYLPYRSSLLGPFNPSNHYSHPTTTQPLLYSNQQYRSHHHRPIHDHFTCRSRLPMARNLQRCTTQIKLSTPL